MSRHSPPPVVRRCELELQSIQLSSDSEFNAHRNSRLQSLLQHHFNNDHNSAWKQLVIQHGIATAADLPRSVDELRNLPIVTKSFLREANYASRPAVRDSEIRMTVLTSGSTGAPLSIPQSFSFSRRVWGEMFVRSLAAVGHSELCSAPGYVLGHFTNTIRNTGTYAASSSICEMLGPTAVLGVTSSPPEDHAALIRRRGIEWIAASPGFFIALAAWSAKNNNFLASSTLRALHAGGAPIDETSRLRMMAQLGVSAFHHVYASTELGYIGVAVRPGGPYSLFSDEYIVEIVDEHGNHVRAGERGRVVISVLPSDAAPLIRYENGDTARYVGTGGPLRHFVLLDDLGRSATAFLCDAKIAYDDIAKIPQLVRASGIPIDAFQLVKQRNGDGRDRICLRVESTHGSREELEASISSALTSYHQIEYHLRSGELAPTSIEVFSPGELTRGRFKLPLFVDETV